MVTVDVGTNAVSGRYIVSMFGGELLVHRSIIRWVKGPIVATVWVSALDDADQSVAIENLSLRMDRRIDDVLAGKIRVAAIIPSPTPSSDARDTASREGFDLPAMLIKLADLPEGAMIETEGFVSESDGISGAAER